MIGFELRRQEKGTLFIMLNFERIMNGISNSQSISKNEMFMREKIVAGIFHMSEINSRMLDIYCQTCK